MPEHHAASAADFRKRIKDEDCYEAPVYVILPKCGLEVLLRKPKPLAYTLIGAPLPGIPDKDADSAVDGQPRMSPEETAQVAGWLAKLWGNVFVQPKLSLSPGVDENAIHPDWIPSDDQKFVWSWLRGEVNDSGEPSLSTFPASVQG